MKGVIETDRLAIDRLPQRRVPRRLSEKVREKERERESESLQAMDRQDHPPDLRLVPGLRQDLPLQEDTRLVAARRLPPVARPEGDPGIDPAVTPANSRVITSWPATVLGINAST